jgi:hypothetical protein
MNIRFVFDQSQDGPPAALPTIANALIDLQRIWNYIAFLSVDEHEFARPDEYRLEFDLRRLIEDPSAQKQEILKFYDAFSYSLAVSRMRYASPLEIEAAIETTETAVDKSKISISRLKSIIKVIASVLTIDLLRERMYWDTEFARQRAIEAALKNQERALNLSKRIDNPIIRDEFLRKMAGAIEPLTRPHTTHRLKLIQVEEKETETSSAAPA